MSKRFFNGFYLSLAILGVVLANIFFNQQKNTISFYGFAETNETAINYNHSVMVNEIHVMPGQYVNKGDILLSISRIKSKESLPNQPYSISELRAEEETWQREKEYDIDVIKAERKLKLENLNQELSELEKKLQHRESILRELSTLNDGQSGHQSLSNKIEAIKKERKLLEDAYAIQIKALENQKVRGNNPYKEQIIHLEAELAFNEEHRIQPIQVVAPTDGIVGNLHCKAAEHVLSFRPLLSFYEPHPTLIKGYVHEDLSLKVLVADSFLIRSVKDPTVCYKGLVTGLGSRIVEIPERLRKIPEYKTYGREVTVQIPPENTFLQKEKVALELVYQRTSVASAHAKNRD
ncbi:MAG: hypothetical protein AAF632_02460 [Bacteroidota bacterium]